MMKGVASEGVGLVLRTVHQPGNKMQQLMLSDALKHAVRRRPEDREDMLLDPGNTTIGSLVQSRGGGSHVVMLWDLARPTSSSSSSSSLSPSSSAVLCTIGGMVGRVRRGERAFIELENGENGRELMKHDDWLQHVVGGSHAFVCQLRPSVGGIAGGDVKRAQRSSPPTASPLDPAKCPVSSSSSSSSFSSPKKAPGGSSGPAPEPPSSVETRSAPAGFDRSTAAPAPPADAHTEARGRP